MPFLSGLTRTRLGGFEQDILGRSAEITITFPAKLSGLSASSKGGKPNWPLLLIFIVTPTDQFFKIIKEHRESMSKHDKLAKKIAKKVTKKLSKKLIKAIYNRLDLEKILSSRSFPIEELGRGDHRH
jgi:hypothetical protein